MRRFSARPVMPRVISAARVASTAAAAKAGSSWWRAAGSFLFGGSAAVAAATTAALCKKGGDYPEGHRPRPELPTYSIAEVKKHTDGKTGCWVTFKGGVYDITSLLQGHPGGTGRLLMSGGCDLAIFWHVYRMHYQKHVLDFVETFRIGNLTPEDAIKMETEFVFNDPYANDPYRPNPDLLHTLEAPFCGEPLLARIGETFYTPNDLHYVRLHLPVADVSPEDWRLTVDGVGVTKRVFTLKEIKENFEHHTLACTLQCAGNRREDFESNEGHHVFISPQWRVAAFSNAKYTGVYLRDVLKACGVDVDALHYAEFPHPTMKHVWFDGSDETEDGMSYGVSIPIEKAVSPRGDCLLTWEMNGEPLPKDHGYPCRTLVPGHVGNKSCKFIEHISITTPEQPKPWHSKSYLNFPPDMTFEEHLSKWDKMTPEQREAGIICQWMPVQSLISDPAPDCTIGVDKNCDSIYVRGCSWSGNGTGMSRVDVSKDGGKNFTAARFLPKPADVVARETYQRRWSWFQFEKNIPLSEDEKKKLRAGQKVDLVLTSKGVDYQFNVQPETVLPFYNARGVVVNSMYHVPVTLDPNMPKGKRELVKGQDHFNPPTGGRFLRQWEKHGWTSRLAKAHEEIVAAHKK